MKKYCVLLLFLGTCLGVLGQEVTMVPSIEKHSGKNEYKVTAQFGGLLDAGIAKVKYSIPAGVDLFVPPNGSLNSTIKDGKLNFYAYSVAASGELTTVFVIGSEEPLSEQRISVMLQYNVGDDRHDLSFDPIIISPEVAQTEYEDDFSEYEVDVEEASIASTSGSEMSGSETETTTTTVETETKSHVETETPVTEKSLETGSYTVQILSLSNYNESRVSKFCKEHNLKKSDLVKRNKDGATKISVGVSLSKSEAQSLKQRIIEENNISGAFVVKVD